MTQEQAIKKVERELQGKAKSRVVNSIVKALREDLILPMLDLKRVVVKTEVFPGRIVVCIGRRDWWFTGRGEMTGVGTLMQ